MRSKTCSVCGKKKTVSLFAKSAFRSDGKSRKADGFRPECKACQWDRQKARMMEWTDEQKERASARHKRNARKWDAAHPHSRRARQANEQTRRRDGHGRVSAKEVEAVWMQWNNACWICGHPATEVDHFRPLNNSSGGTNTVDNIRPVCRFCNHKRDHLWRGEDYAMKEAALIKQIRALADQASPRTSPPHGSAVPMSGENQ